MIEKVWEGGSKILNPLICVLLVDQKFWIPSSALVAMGIVNFKSLSVFIGASENLNLHFAMGEPLEKRNLKDHLG